MTEPTYISDHPTRAVANLISKFDGATLLKLLVLVLVNEVQELENTYFDLISERQLSDAVGAQLDQYGKIVGELRSGLFDTAYRRFIEARILTNLSEGEVPRLIEVVDLITEAISVLYMPTYPAAYIIQYTRDGFTSESFRSRVRRQVEAITPSGVGLEVVEANEGAFGFADDPTALGFGEGEWAEII